MAKITGGIESMISGMIGPIVLVNYNGKHYIRRAPRERAKNDWTDGQKKARVRFREINAFWKHFYYTPIRQIWESAAEGMRGVNLFIKTNMPAFGADGVIKDLDRLHFSAGKLSLPHKLKAEKSVYAPGKIQVSWEDDSGSGFATAEDELLMMISQEGKFTGPVKTGFTREMQSALIQLPDEAIQGIYLFFGNEKRKIYSVDQWFGF